MSDGYRQALLHGMILEANGWILLRDRTHPIHTNHPKRDINDLLFIDITDHNHAYGSSVQRKHV